jgi:multidrug resistance efflux pump
MTERDKQLYGLTTFIQLERHARSAENIQRLQFIIANETYKLFKYRQAAVWSLRHNQQFRLVTLSGISQIDASTPFVQWLGQFINTKIDSEIERPVVFSADDIDVKDRDNFSEFVDGNLLFCPVKTAAGQFLGGVSFVKKDAWHEAEISLIEMLMESYAHAWSALLPQNRRWKKTGFLHTINSKKFKQIAFLILIAVMFIPVSQSVLAPASVVPVKPKAVTSPLEGVIEEILVAPNEQVTDSTVLFKIDDTKLLNQVAIAQKAFDVAQAEHFKAVQKSFGNADVKGDVTLLKAKMEQKASEISYYNKLLSKTEVYSPGDGVVIFSNANDWIGKPVVTGEKVMQLASVNDLQIEIWLPSDDAIDLEPGSEVLLFLNTDPINPITAKLERISYSPVVNDNNILAFRILAQIDAGQDQPRLGLQGTAKLYGEQVPLFYYLLRRPATKLRQWIGL